MNCDAPVEMPGGKFTVFYKGMGSLTTQPGSQTVQTLFTRATPEHLSYVPSQKVCLLSR